MDFVNQTKRTHITKLSYFYSSNMLGNCRKTFIVPISSIKNTPNSTFKNNIWICQFIEQVLSLRKKYVKTFFYKHCWIRNLYKTTFSKRNLSRKRSLYKLSCAKNYRRILSMNYFHQINFT